MKNIKKILRFIITLLLTVSIIIYILINLISSTILNETYILSKLDENKYYDEIYELVESNFENYIHQSGLDEEVIENIVTKEKVKEDTKKIIINIYDGLNEEISIEEIKQNLNNNIEKSMEDRSLTEQERQSIDTFVEKICEEYKTTILHTSYEGKINSMYKQVNKYAKIGKKASLITAGLSVIILILLSLKRIYKSVSLIGTSLLSIGVLSIILKIYVNTKIKVQHILILNDAISNIIRNISEEILGKIMVFGCTSLVIGIVLIIISNFIHNIIKYGNEKA